MWQIQRGPFTDPFVPPGEEDPFCSSLKNGGSSEPTLPPRFEKGERRWGKGVEKSIPFLFSPSPPLASFSFIRLGLPPLPPLSYPPIRFVPWGGARGGGYIPSRVIDQSSCWGEERNLSRIYYHYVLPCLEKEKEAILILSGSCTAL